MDLAGLGRRLRAAGVHPRALRGCFGADDVTGVMRRLAEGLRAPRPMPPATVAPWLLIAGRAVPARVAEARLGDDLDRLVELDLVDRRGDRVTARHLLLPFGESIGVCDRPDTDGARSIPPPDDSTYHLIGALPRRRVDRWLDVGTGAALVPLASPGLGRTIVGTDVAEDALRLAALGARLSGVEHLRLGTADLLDGAGTGWPLVTFNAPIPGAAGPRYRRGGVDVLARFWAAAPAAVATTGEVLVHSQLPDDPLAGLPPGAATVARYTPDQVRPAFGVTRWQPAPGPRRVVDVPLSPHRRHVRRADVDPSSGDG